VNKELLNKIFMMFGDNLTNLWRT